ncbi:probable trna pseudouridine [Lynx pardinus]|uniref:tRNA pseudouridine(55) synthase n=1 Tax=Lynx pardinus TaxID=191816 RepID=A0A485MHD2_LYNPA|nr:probable trna pseudouridine [Lynx pardinus]
MAAAEAAVVSSSLETDTARVPETAGTAAATAATSSATAAAAAVAAAARTGSEATASKAALATKLLSLSGVFAVHKPKGPTSAELLNRLKEKLLAEAGMPSPEWAKRKKQTLKIGHGGTLDSAARGVLVVGIGRGTKMLTSMLSGSKRYTAIGELGKATDTLDSTGKVTEEKPYVFNITLMRKQTNKQNGFLLCTVKHVLIRRSFCSSRGGPDLGSLQSFRHSLGRRDAVSSGPGRCHGLTSVPVQC